MPKLTCTEAGIGCFAGQGSSGLARLPIDGPVRAVDATEALAMHARGPLHLPIGGPAPRKPSDCPVGSCGRGGAQWRSTQGWAASPGTGAPIEAMDRCAAAGGSPGATMPPLPPTCPDVCGDARRTFQASWRAVWTDIPCAGPWAGPRSLSISFRSHLAQAALKQWTPLNRLQAPPHPLTHWLGQAGTAQLS